MKSTAELKRLAKDALRGKWKTAVLAALVAALFGGAIFSGNESVFEIALENITEDLSWVDTAAEQMLLRWIGALMVATSLWAIVCLLLSGAVQMGYALFNLDLLDGKEVSVKTLFSQMDRFFDGLVMNILTTLFVVLWSLLLIVPGVIKGFAYSLTPYILAEHPEFTPREAIRKSEEWMNGNKWDMFYLGLTFIGWGLLAVLLPMLPFLGTVALVSAGIMGEIIAIVLMVLDFIALQVLLLCLQAYVEATYAAFYQDVRASRIAMEHMETPADWYQPADVQRTEMGG